MARHPAAGLPRSKRIAFRRSGVLLAAVLVVGLLVWLAVSVHDESLTSRRQAQWFSERARELTFVLQPGPSPAIRFPGPGPFDQRLGYHDLPQWVARLEAQGYTVTEQARMSPAMLDWHARGLYDPYREKAQAGLTLQDCGGALVHRAGHPARVYRDFADVPPVLVQALLFIEDRQLLDPPATRNPALDWGRFGKATLDQLLRLADATHTAGGGSTLATQIEKYRHSPGGRTVRARDKLSQMASASMRAYAGGEDTLPRRRQIVVDYLNTVPLAARAGLGEVHGVGDALWAWYGRDFDETNRLLGEPVADPEPGGPQRHALAFRQALVPYQALAFKQALSLMVAQRRPSHYLAPAGAAALRELTDSHLRLLADAGIIGPTLRDAALPLALVPAPLPRSVAVEPTSFVDRKAATALRGHLQTLLALPRAYDLDRLDLTAHSTLSDELQRAAAALLRGLGDVPTARAAGLYGHQLLNDGDDTSKIAFSFTLFESNGEVNLLRAQTDSIAQPFDLNEGARLDLGSTAKLRTLVTYLEQVAALHERWHALDRQTLAAWPVDRGDAIGNWARAHLLQHTERDLPAMLDAALERTYSASPAEQFVTGRGVHRFENFDKADDSRRMSVREAFTRSVNLVFIRVMRDVVHHVQSARADRHAAVLDDPTHPQRQVYLARFADREGSEYIARFHRKYAGHAAPEIEDLLLQGRQATPVRLASIFHALQPDAGESELRAFLARRLPSAQGSAALLHERYQGGRWSLADRGYLAGVHPLELWVAAHLQRHPQATLGQTLAASTAERQAVYGWLFGTRRKAAQDQRIRSLMEEDAFAEVHRAWQRLGYPFDSLTPSYATALGASGDRPAALAELMGILVNSGRRLPTQRLAALHFASDTPYETRLGHRPPAAEQVLNAEVAAAVRRALVDVVQVGTARRLKGALQRADGSLIDVGGKTGTGDHRFDTHDRAGKVVSTRVVTRSASMVFMLGERHFGTVMAFVREPDAERFRFTSALPTQLLKNLAPHLQSQVEGRGCAQAAPSAHIGRVQ